MTAWKERDAVTLGGGGRRWPVHASPCSAARSVALMVSAWRLKVDLQILNVEITLVCRAGGPCRANAVGKTQNQLFSAPAIESRKRRLTGDAVTSCSPVRPRSRPPVFRMNRGRRRRAASARESAPTVRNDAGSALARQSSFVVRRAKSGHRRPVNRRGRRRHGDAMFELKLVDLLLVLRCRWKSPERVIALRNQAETMPVPAPPPALVSWQEPRALRAASTSATTAWGSLKPDSRTHWSASLLRMRRQRSVWPSSSWSCNAANAGWISSVESRATHRWVTLKCVAASDARAHPSTGSRRT